MQLTPKLREWILTVNPLRDPYGVKKKQLKDLVKKLEDAPEPRGLGGPGSGNFGHAGRPGQVGGSAESDGQDNSAAAVAARNGITPEMTAPILERIRKEATTDAERAYAEEMAVAEAIVKRDLQGGDTWARHTNVDGSYTEERLQLHDRIFEKFFEDHRAKHGSLPPTGVKEPVVTFMAGMPGAGKSTAAKDLEESPNAIAINPDVMKTYLPEYNGGLGGTLVQRESGDLADRLMVMAAQKRMNVIIDGTLKTSGGLPPTFGDGAVGKMASFKDNNYRVEVRFVDIGVNESIQNTVTRFHQEFAKSGYGRYVPTSFSRALADPIHGTKPAASFNIARQTTYQGKPIVDAWRHTRGWTGDPKTSNYEIASSGTLTPGGGARE